MTCPPPCGGSGGLKIRGENITFDHTLVTTMIPKARLKRSMYKYDLKIVQKLANCAIDDCKIMATCEITLTVRQSKLIHYILVYKNIDSIQ